LWGSRKGAARLYLPLFIMSGLYTGARKGAILGLKWTQVDLVRGRLDFNEPGRPKTKKRRAVVPIPRPLLWFLRAAQRRANCPYVIARNGEQVPERSINRHFSAARDRAGLDREVIVHTLRHSAGTWMAQAGVDMHQISGYLGHSYARTTELYAHAYPDHLAEAKAAMERRRS
jgi:integrase